MSVIVVGLDGSAGARAALRWALEETRLRKASLQVVHAWTVVMHGKGAREALDETLAEVVGEEAGVPVEAKLVKANPAEALVEAAANADVFVVGSRGHGGFAGLLLGSVSQQCAHQAPCPVVIVRKQKS